MRAADRYVAQNRRARHDYLIEDTLEAGLVLQGSEVKVLRKGQASIAEAYANESGGELFLVNANIPEYASSAHFNHEPRRPRKLLLHRKEMDRLLGAIRREGVTIVPLVDLLQRARAGQDRARARPRQAQGRQARGREGAGLAAQPRPHHARARHLIFARVRPAPAAGRRASEMDLVFGLPAIGLARRPRPDAKQHAAVPFEGAGTDIIDRAEELRTDAVVFGPA